MSTTVRVSQPIGRPVWVSMALWSAAVVSGAAFLAIPQLAQQAVGGRETGMAAAIDLAFICLPTLAICETAGLVALVRAWWQRSTGWQVAAVAHAGFLLLVPA